MRFFFKWQIIISEERNGDVYRMVALLVRASEKVELYWHIRTACKFIYKQFLTKPNNIK